jgi:hypothetical protein
MYRGKLCSHFRNARPKKGGEVVRGNIGRRANYHKEKSSERNKRQSLREMRSKTLYIPESALRAARRYLYSKCNHGTVGEGCPILLQAHSKLVSNLRTICIITGASFWHHATSIEFTVYKQQQTAWPQSGN